MNKKQKKNWYVYYLQSIPSSEPIAVHFCHNRSGQAFWIIPFSLHNPKTHTKLQGYLSARKLINERLTLFNLFRCPEAGPPLILAEFVNVEAVTRLIAQRQLLARRDLLKCKKIYSSETERGLRKETDVGGCHMTWIIKSFLSIVSAWSDRLCAVSETAAKMLQCFSMDGRMGPGHGIHMVPDDGAALPDLLPSRSSVG